jgi:carboxymethylenebutenolidase
MTAKGMVEFDSAAGRASGFLARPGNRAGVIVIQEWWGIVPHVKDLAGRFAAQGYTALAPDLYHGKTTVEAEEAQHLMQGLDWGRAAKEIAGAAKCLREEHGAERVGCIGFCMGGALSFMAATSPGIDAFVAFYGIPPAGAAPLDDITAPGLVFFGEKEGFFSVPDAQAWAERQRKRGREAEVVVYKGAGHAFMNDTRPEAHHKEHSADAWQKTLAHLRKHLVRS